MQQLLRVTCLQAPFIKHGGLWIQASHSEQLAGTDLWLALLSQMHAGTCSQAEPHVAAQAAQAAGQSRCCKELVQGKSMKLRRNQNARTACMNVGRADGCRPVMLQAALMVACLLSRVRASPPPEQQSCCHPAQA